MTDAEEQSLRARAVRGQEAARLLTDPLLLQVLESIEHDVMIKANSLPHGDYDGRDVYWRELAALASFKAKLRSYILNGKQSEETLFKRLTRKITG